MSDHLRGFWRGVKLAAIWTAALLASCGMGFGIGVGAVWMSLKLGGW